MAMLKSSGVAQDAASDMSIKLAGDLASFHNLETDEAFYKLRAGISGESEPLKTLCAYLETLHKLLDLQCSC